MLTCWIFAPMPHAASVADGDALVVHDCSYGEVYEFTEAGCSASIENTGTRPLKLSIVPVQPRNTVAPNAITLGPRARVPLSLRVVTDDVAGAITWTYRIDHGRDSPHFLRASGFISSVLDVSRPEIKFGSLDAANLPSLQTIALTSSLDPRIRVTQVLSAPPMLQAVIGPDAKSLTVQVGPDAPWGSLDGVVKLALDHAQQKQVWVHVTGNVVGDVAPPDNPHWVGEIAWQPKNVLKVPLIDRDGRDFSIGNVSSTEFAATYDSAECEPARSGCRTLLIHVSKSQPAGMFKSNLDVVLPDRNKHLRVGIQGVLGERPKPGGPASPPAITKIPVDMPQADDGITAVPPLKVQPDPPGAGPLLKWTVNQQRSVYGYQILRGNSADGPFELMDPHVMPKIDNGRGPVAYRWRDTSAVKGQAYWYYVVVLYSSGDRHALSAPQRTIAK
ncbi:MAG TPA: hypothetical protein VGC30_03910 [Dokdonella sp.]